MFKYIHNVNAKVEDGRRYLTDVVKLELETIDIMDPVTPFGKIGEKHRVSLFSAIQDGVETITPVAVHPKLPSDMEPTEVPTYSVPATLKILVRADVKDLDTESAGFNHRNWIEEVVTVLPIVDETFVEADYAKAIAYYEELAHQLSQGDSIRNFRRDNVILRDAYNTGNSRSH